MRGSFIAVVAVAASCLQSPLRAADSLPPTTPPLVYSRQNAFSIPFKVEDLGPATQMPVEVQLHVSEDQGSTWHPAAKVDPRAGRFQYRALQDGQYWFMVRTLDIHGKLQPEGPAEAELKVLVDTKMPSLELEVRRGDAGEIHVAWYATDANIKPETLKISYQPIGGALGWQPVAIDPLRCQLNGETYSGETTWWPEAHSGPVAVRAEITDQADNKTYSQDQAEQARPRQGPLVDRMPVGESIAAGKPEAPTSPYQSPGTRSPEAVVETIPAPAGAPPHMPTAFPVSTPAATVTPPPAAPSAENMPAPEMISPEPQRPETAVESIPAPAPTSYSPPTAASADHGLGPRYADMAPSMPAAAPVEPVTQAPAIEPPYSSPPVMQQPPVMQMPPAQQAPVMQPAPTMQQPHVKQSFAPQLPVASTPVIATPVTSAQPATTAPIAPPVTAPQQAQQPPIAIPPGVVPRIVNQTMFEMEYDISAVGPEGLRSIELWGTRDGGRHWLLAARDEDKQSPFLVNVPGEGEYGFRIVIETGAGLRTQAPRPGELPEVWVVVDSTRPTATLEVAEPSADSQPGVLTLRWQAADAQLAPRPITLSFRSSASEQWTTLAAGLENTGHYDWRLDSRAPQSIYVRLEVTDAAGNVTSVELPNPISMARIRPNGRIVDVRPVRDATDR
jgi:hypothetical protein